MQVCCEDGLKNYLEDFHETLNMDSCRSFLDLVTFSEKSASKEQN